MKSDTCNRCGRIITPTIYLIPIHFHVAWQFVCHDCYVKICRDNLVKSGRFTNQMRDQRCTNYK